MFCLRSVSFALGSGSLGCMFRLMFRLFFIEQFVYGANVFVTSLGRLSSHSNCC